MEESLNEKKELGELASAIAEEIEELLEVVEIEAHAGTGRRKPRGRIYVFRVGKQRIEVTDPIITGRKILELAGKIPPEKYTLRQILHGGETKVIGLDEKVDLRAPGIERFRAMPCTAQDGQ
jgi:hypothetical protein